LLGYSAGRPVEPELLVGVKRERVRGEACVARLDRGGVAAPVMLCGSVVPSGVEGGPAGLLRLLGVER
jgi:hypothetical protein